MCKPASRDKSSASVELCETKVCFLLLVQMFDFQKVHLMLILSLPGLLIVLKDIQHGTGTKCIVLDGMRSISVETTLVCFPLDGVVHVWLGSLQRFSPEIFLGLFNLVRYGMKYFNHKIPKSESGNTVHA